MKVGRSRRRYKDTITYEDMQWAENFIEENVRREQLIRLFEKKAAAAAASNGLVYQAISHRASVQVYASRLKVSFRRAAISTVSTRGRIVGWSRKSRKRMMDLLAAWRTNKSMWFVTLTYHDYPAEPRAWKRDMDAFLKRLRRKYPNVGGMWKLEFQRRGAPHFHLLLAIDTDYFDLMRFVTDAWADIAHKHSQYRGAYATNVRTIISRRHAMHYAAKYMSKSLPERVDGEGEVTEVRCGRFWARFGDFDASPVIEFATSASQADDWRKFIVQWLQIKGSRFARKLADVPPKWGWSVYGIGLDESPGNETWNFKIFAEAAYQAGY